MNRPPLAPSPAEPSGDSARAADGTRLPKSWPATLAVIWAGQAASIFSSSAASFAAIWYLTETTASPLWLSLAAIASLLPLALLSPFGGVIADRHDRKRVMIAADGCAGAFSLALAIALAAGAASPPLLLALLAVRSAAQAFHGPAFAATMPSLVPERHLVRVSGMDQTVTSLSTIAGPAAGILLYTAAGLQGAMLLDAACAAVACCCLAVARIPPNPAPEAPRPVLSELREGARSVARDAGLRNLMVLTMLVMLLFMPASSLSPLMVAQHFQGSGWDASLVEAVFGAGLLAGSVVMAVWGGGRRSVPVVLGSGIALGAATACCGLLPSGQFPLFAALMAAAAVALGCFNAPILALIQRRTPGEALGRAMGIFQTGSSLAAPIGLVFSGFLADTIGIAPWFCLCGVLVAACCTLAFLDRGIRSLDAAGEAPQAGE